MNWNADGWGHFLAYLLLALFTGSLCDMAINRILKQSVPKTAVLSMTVTAVFLCIYGFTPAALRCILLCQILMVAGIFDLVTYQIPDCLHLLVAMAGLIRFQPLPALLGFLLAPLPFLVVALKTEKIGGGDVKLMAASGFALGVTGGIWMKNLLKNRIVLGLLCIITALIICFGLTPMFNDALKSKVELVRVTTEIRKGDQITAGMVAVVETGGYNLPSDVVYQKEDIIGKYANADLYKGDYILKSKLSDTPMLKNEYLSKLNGENRAISITIKSFAAGLSGKLERGDIVSLIASDVGEARKTLIPNELQYVEIIATTDSNGNDRNIQEQSRDSEDTELASTITVLATPQQARLLAELEQTGKLHAALVYRGDAENAQKFLDEQAKLLETLYPVRSEGLTYETENHNGTQASPPAGVSENQSAIGNAPATQN